MSEGERDEGRGEDGTLSDEGRRDRAPERGDPQAAAHDSQLHPDTPATMQGNYGQAPGRQRYAHSRPGDYSRDFRADGSGSHPVKPLSEDAVDENGIPKIAATEPPRTQRAND